MTKMLYDVYVIGVRNDKYIAFHLLMQLYCTTFYVRSVCIIPLILYHILDSDITCH